MVDYFTASCSEKGEMLAPTVEQFYDAENQASAEVVEACEGASGSSQREFVVQGIDVIGTPAAEQVTALVELGFYEDTQHSLTGVTSIEVVLALPARWHEVDEPLFLIRSLSETVSFQGGASDL